ncbi:MAG: TonB-dependent receptor, partial [Bacteroidia bacterium]|nr:TonB-dependent receptor [Bacteroidia bacterium]
MKSFILMILFIVSSSIALFSQEVNFNGIVTDAATELPIENATIQLKHNNKYTVSNSKGEFVIMASLNDELIISHLNYENKKLKITALTLKIVLQPKSINLEDIIIKANVLQDISQSNVIIDNVKGTTQPRNVGDLFRDIRGFGIQKRGAYASEPVFRAFKYEQLNVQYDGGMKVLNACPNRMDPITTHVIPDEIEKIEIVRGPFTVRFGQNFGGIINLVSKKNSSFKNGISGSVESGYEINGENLSTRGSIKYNSNKFDAAVNAEYRNYGNYEDGNGVEVPSSFKTTDYSIKVGYEPTMQQRLQLSWRQSFGRDIKHAGLPMDSPYDDSYLVGLDYKRNDISEKISTFSIKGFYSYVDHLMTNEGRPSFMMTEANSNVFATTYGGKAELTITPSDRLFLFTGIDANLIKREGNRIRLVKVMNGNTLPEPRTFVDKIWQDAQLNDIGIFAESNYKISDGFTLTAGIRAD